MVFICSRTGTFTTLSGGGTWNQRSLRLMEQLRRDPNMLHVIKDELRELLDNNLEKRGIAKVQYNITNIRQLLFK